MPRMRTIEGCVEQFKTDDPGSQITKHALRQLVITGKVKSVRIGIKYLVNYDDLLSYLSNPPAAKEESQQYGKLRKIT